MAKAKVTKKQLLSSSLALVVSGAMLIGTTMAWFTDSKTSGLNTIEAGNIALSVKYVDGDELKDLTSDTELFNVTNMQPGDTGSFSLEVANGGSIDAKVKLDFDITEKGLVDSLWFSVGDETTKRPMSTLETYNFEKELTAETTPVTYTLTYGMYDYVKQSDVDGKEFAAYVTVMATQNKEDAEYEDVLLLNSDFQEALTNLKDNGTISLGNSEFDATATLGTVNGSTISGNGTEATTVNVNANKISAENVTLANMTINGTGAAGTNGSLMITGKNTTLSNVNYVGEAGQIAVSVSGANTVFNKVNISNSFRGIQFWQLSGDNYITDSVLDINGYTFNIDAVSAGSKLYVQDTTLKGWTSYTSGIELVSFDNCKFEKNGYNYCRPYSETEFKNCTFSDDFKFNASGSGTYTVTFENCTYKGQPLTEETFEEMKDNGGWNTNVKVVLK